MAIILSIYSAILALAVWQDDQNRHDTEVQQEPPRC